MNMFPQQKLKVNLKTLSVTFSIEPLKYKATQNIVTVLNLIV